MSLTPFTFARSKRRRDLVPRVFQFSQETPEVTDLGYSTP
jgi:hypothetical protein